MYSHKVLVNNEGFVVEECVLLKDNVVQNIEVQEGQFLVNYYDKKYIKPKWDFEKEKWTEGATDEEIKEWEEANKPKPKEPNQQDILNAKLISDNAQLLKDNEKQSKLNAELLLKIAMLGGNVNV